MSTTTSQSLEKQLSRGEIAPLYLLFGAEGYLRDAAARRITDAALADASLREFNETSFSLASTDVQQAIASAEQLPMMAARRVVRITDFGKLGEDDEAALLRYCARPSESSVVLFVADDFDKRRKLSKSLLDACVSVEFAAMDDEAARAWARDYLKSIGAEADERAINQLIGLAGTGARRLKLELDKLAATAAPAGKITTRDVDVLVARSRELSNFALTDDLVAGNRRRALETLRQLLDDGAEPIMLIGLLSLNYHKLALAKSLMAQGAPTTEVNRLAPYNFEARKKFLELARRTDARALARYISRIADADLAIKTSLGGGGGRGSRLQMEMLVCELTA
jgi:DNA polymerase-3 subunit delta